LPARARSNWSIVGICVRELRVNVNPVANADGERAAVIA
jgi:hypothetical protein